jgi:hypothetical protein
MNAINRKEAKAGKERKIIEYVKQNYLNAFHTPKKEYPYELFNKYRSLRPSK